MLYRFGDIVLVDYPFTNGVGSKRRPGLILLSEDDGDILFARITSKDRDGEWEVVIQDFMKAGLLHASIIRLSKMVSLESSLIERQIGRLSNRDQDAALLTLQRLTASIGEFRTPGLC
jgi:mRNA interferase MazF